MHLWQLVQHPSRSARDSDVRSKYITLAVSVAHNLHSTLFSMTPGLFVDANLIRRPLAIGHYDSIAIAFTECLNGLRRIGKQKDAPARLLDRGIKVFEVLCVRLVNAFILPELITSPIVNR